MHTVEDVRDKIARHYVPTLRKKGNVGNNTWAYDKDGTAVIKYHDTEIVSAVANDPEDITPTLWLDHGGYMTPTTKQRMDWFLPDGVRIVGRNGSGFPDRWREGDWQLELWRPLTSAHFIFSGPVGLHLVYGMWHIWGADEPYLDRAEQVRMAAATWARRYKPNMLEHSSAPGATWCADCTAAWPDNPTTRHFMEMHWQANSRRVYNRRQIYSALSSIGVEAADIDWIDPRIVRKALRTLIPDHDRVTTILTAADGLFEADYKE